MLGDALNAGDNCDDQEDYVFRGPFSTPPLPLLMTMQFFF